MNDKCDRCGGPMLALFTSVVCRDDCGRPGVEAPEGRHGMDLGTPRGWPPEWPPCRVLLWLDDAPPPRYWFAAATPAVGMEHWRGFDKWARNNHERPMWERAAKALWSRARGEAVLHGKPSELSKTQRGILYAVPC